MDELRYPIGRYAEQPFSVAQRDQWLLDIRFLPGHLEQAIENLDEAQLDTPYREAGWTLRQVVHHVADSHVNAYTRFKLALTEDLPVIKPYDENAWARLPDVQAVPLNVSLTLLHALHTRWSALLESIGDEQWQREVVHPEHGRKMSLWYLLGLYAWHGRHHTAHITTLRETMRW